jgi:hypothetical protein
MSNEQELRAEEMQALFKPIPVWKWFCFISALLI